MKKLHGFPDEYLYVLPKEILNSFISSKIIKELYITDIGYYPNANEHYVYREFGAEEWILLLCIHGQGQVKFKDKEWKISRGSVALIPPNKEHTYYSDANSPWDLFWVHFTGKEIMAFLPSSIQSEDEFFVTRIDYDKELNQLIKQFWEMLQIFSTGFSYEVLFYASQVLRTVLACFSFYDAVKYDLSANGNDYVTKSIQYIYDHMKEKILVEDISQELSLSTNYLNRIFSKVMGVSVNRFINNIKMKQANQYLLNTSYPIQKIAQSLGYNDQYYFSRLFKKTYGTSPKKYRDQQSRKR